MMKSKTVRFGLLVTIATVVCTIFCFTRKAEAAVPAVDTISPSSGSVTPDTAVTFTCTYTDSDGWANLQEAKLLISANTSALTGAVYLYYDQNNNKLYLRDDGNTAWLGGYAPGAANVIENSQVKLNCSASAATGARSALTVKFNVSFRTVYSGKTYNTYLYAKDDIGGEANWYKKGTYIVNRAPQVGTISPGFGASVPGATFSFTTTYSDADSWLNLRYCYFLVNTSTSAGTNCLYTYYDKGTNRLYLRNDANTSWLGGYSPGAGNIIENSYVKLSCGSTTVSGAGDVLTIKWSVIFKAAFSGQKNTYLYVQDYAGSTNGWTKKGTWTALPDGAMIGMAGGEVISNDGKVKIIIPAGALNEPTGISVSAVNKEDLQGSEPTGTSLLSVVKCEPQGLVFNTPVSIIYTLSQAEVPGTAVELGFYDSLQGKIIPTGENSTVPKDGVTLTFSILHFSTYAALINLTPQDVPIGLGVKIPLPDLLTGAFSHRIPLSVPSGRKGMQPALGLVYHSSGGNSWTGVGFGLNPGYIVRSTRLGPPSYIDTQDTFYLISDGGTTELVNLVDNVYQAKVEASFAKFYKEADGSWKVLGKDGSVLRFGETAESREESALGIYSWGFTKSIDTNGNYIKCSYVKEQGKSYLQYVDYTGNENTGLSPTYSVEFITESRQDVFSSYISGAKIATAKRLKEVKARANNELVWRYTLNYDYSQDTNRSLLKSVTQYASDDKNLPAQTMSYQKSK